MPAIALATRANEAGSGTAAAAGAPRNVIVPCGRNANDWAECQFQIGKKLFGSPELLIIDMLKNQTSPASTPLVALRPVMYWVLVP